MPHLLAIATSVTCPRSSQRYMHIYISNKMSVSVTVIYWQLKNLISTSSMKLYSMKRTNSNFHTYAKTDAQCDIIYNQ